MQNEEQYMLPSTTHSETSNYMNSLSSICGKSSTNSTPTDDNVVEK